jgi:tetratricopeptide (TPR) repeat protein
MFFSKRAGFVAVVLATSLHAASAQDAGSACAPITIRSDPAAVVQACTQALAAADLTKQQRATLLFYRGRGHKALEHLSAAETDFNAGLALAPDHVGLNIFIGWDAFDRRDFDGFNRIVAKLLERFPNESAVHDLAGVAAEQRKDRDTALSEYNKALELDQQSVMALDHRGHLYWRNSALRAALADYHTLAVSKDRAVDDKYTYFNGLKISYRTNARLSEVQLLENFGHSEPTEKQLAEFVRVEPGAVSYGWWGVYCLRRSQLDCAQEKLEKALTYAPDFWFLHSRLSDTLLYKKQYDAALRSIDRAIALNPKSGPLHYQRALTLRELKRVDEAIKEAVASIHIEPAFMTRLGPDLIKLGYLQPETSGSNLVPMFDDALRACMLDERCW